jgi:hypothetical protein
LNAQDLNAPDEVLVDDKNIFAPIPTINARRA